MSKQKLFQYKVFTSSGSFLATWTDATEPRFSMGINGGVSDMTIDVARPVNAFGEGGDVNVFNEVQCWISDQDATFNSQQIYSGWIADYSPTIMENRYEAIQVHLMPYTTELTDNVWIASNSTAFSFTGTDPANMLITALGNKAETVGGKIGSQSAAGIISSTPVGIALTGRQLDYTFSAQTYRDVIDKARELSPAGTYWYVDGTNTVNFQPRPAGTTHTWLVGREISELHVTKDAKTVKNAAIGIFGKSETSGSTLYVSFGSDSGGYDGSKVQWGTRTYYTTDERVTQVSTAKSLLLNYLDYYNAPLVQAKVTIVDNNGETPIGYDIESILPGQTAVVRNPFRDEQIQPLGNYTLDATPLDAPIQMLELQPMQIIEVNYTLDAVTVTLASAQPLVTNTVYDQARILRDHITQIAPDGLTTTS